VIPEQSRGELRRVRSLWRDLIDLYVSRGEPKLAHSCAQLAVSQGVWRDPAQRPIEYDPSIKPVAVLEPRAFEVCRYLESHFEAIKAEIDRVTSSRGAAAGYFAVHEPLVLSGSWDELMFFEAGIRVENSAALFPVTAGIIDGLPERVKRAGAIMLSKLSPGTHLAPHCGFTNRRLRVHLGIQTPKDAFIRVNDQTLEWQAGRCIVFDDSFEHEVWHFGTEPRIVLLADMPHPDADMANAPAASRELGERIEDFMSRRGVTGICRDSNGALILRPDAQHVRMMEKWIAELGVESVTLDANGRLNDARAR
jgi:aspartyl/asparaginyl beta-hydroxylase